MSQLDKPPKPYKDVKSEFIKQKIRQTDFENEERKSYIHALIWLEKIVTEEKPAGWPTGMMLSNIREQHLKEFKIIKRELSPESIKDNIIQGYVEGIQESLEPENWKLDRIIERLENRQNWKKIKQEN